MAKPKILVIENSIDITGALKSIAHIALDLRSTFDFIFVIPSGSVVKEWIEQQGISVLELPMKELSRKIYSVFVYLPVLFMNAIRLNKIIKQKSISVIHVNDMYNLLPVAIRLLGNSTPYVCHVRFLPDRFPPWLLKLWMKFHFRYAERIVVVSAKVKEMLPEHPKCTIIYGSLPESEKYPKSINSPRKHQHTFLYLANFMEGKGQKYALEAFSSIHFNLPGWKLRFMGSDMGLKKNKRYLNKLKKQADGLGIGQKIEWKEFTNDVEWEYKSADIVLNFSESESFSMTCLEALYFGRPLIASDCGGPVEIIDNHQTGILVQNRNVEAMAESMQLLALNTGLRESLSASAWHKVREKFSKDKTVYPLEDLFLSLVK